MPSQRRDRACELEQRSEAAVARERAVRGRSVGTGENGAVGTNDNRAPLLDDVDRGRQAIGVRGPARTAGGLDHRGEPLIVAAHPHRMIAGPVNRIEHGFTGLGPECEGRNGHRRRRGAIRFGLGFDEPQGAPGCQGMRDAGAGRVC
jgi:hypothetical protein